MEGRGLLGLLILFGPFRPDRIRFMISSLGIFFWIVVLDGVLWEMVHVILLWMSNWRETIWAMKYSLLMAIRSGYDWNPEGMGMGVGLFCVG